MTDKSKASRKHSDRSNGREGKGGLQAVDNATAAALSLGLEMPVRESTFTNARGQTIEINGVSPWLLEGLGAGLRAEWAEDERGSLEPPTYDIPLPGGEVETRAHDKTTLKTDEDREEWAEYEARRAEFARELQERTMRVLLMRGVKTEPPEGAPWEAEQRFMGVRIPKDAMERRYHWVRTEIISSPDELGRLMVAIMALSGIREEALKAAEAAFRNPMEGTNRPASSRSAPSGGGRMEHKPDNGRGRNRAGLAPKA